MFAEYFIVFVVHSLIEFSCITLYIASQLIFNPPAKTVN